MDPVDFEENLFYEQADKPDIFLVTVVENPTAERLKLAGDYEFHVNTMNFALVDLKTKKPLYIWPFRYVRRYGRSETNYQFEAGRKCPSGEGLFSFLTKNDDSEVIFHTIQTRFREIKMRDRDFQKGTSQKGPSPCLPPREYTAPSVSKPKPTSIKQKPKPAVKPKLLKTPSAEYQNVGQEDLKVKQNAVVDDIILKHKQTIKSKMREDDTYGESPIRRDAAATDAYSETNFTPLNSFAQQGGDDDHNYYDVVN